MVLSFILGILVGIAAGVLVTIGQYEKHLRTNTEQLKKANEALGKSNAQQFLLTAEVRELSAQVYGPYNC